MCIPTLEPSVTNHSGREQPYAGTENWMVCIEKARSGAYKTARGCGCGFEQQTVDTGGRANLLRYAASTEMTLRDVIDKYLAVSGGYGVPVALSALGYPREEVERIFSAFDEDYHISRFFHFQRMAGADHIISGFPQTHVALDAEIQSIL
jgi:hypothetical protein